MGQQQEQRWLNPATSPTFPFVSNHRATRAYALTVVSGAPRARATQLPYRIAMYLLLAQRRFPYTATTVICVNSV